MAGVRGAAVSVLFLTDGTTERFYVQLELREAFRLQKPVIMFRRPTTDLASQTMSRSLSRLCTLILRRNDRYWTPRISNGCFRRFFMVF